MNSSFHSVSLSWSCVNDSSSILVSKHSIYESSNSFNFPFMTVSNSEENNKNVFIQ